MINLTILGSTGSIGKKVLSIIRTNHKKFKIIALTAKKNINIMIKQCLEFNPKYIAILNLQSAIKIKKILKEKKCKTKVLHGKKSICEIAELDHVDQVVSAISGIAGLLPTLSAIKKGKIILLANKESLISTGRLFFKYVKKYKAKILPIDSEHNAIFQSLPVEIQKNLGFCNLKKYGIKKIILTGSGGPFLETPLYKLKKITPKQACKHPIWSMGKKISVDSATMMNKGLEYIEARYLFNASNKEIEIIIHPQSIIHSIIHYIDGNLTAQISNPDMKIPISYCMGYPNRISSGIKTINLKKMSKLIFLPPNYKRYPCLKLAIDAFEYGQSAIIVLNAANEIAVRAFLLKKIQFNDIANINRSILEKINISEPNNIESVLEIDKEIREKTKEHIKIYKRKITINKYI